MNVDQYIYRYKLKMNCLFEQFMYVITSIIYISVYLGMNNACVICDVIHLCFPVVLYINMTFQKPT